MRLINLAEAKAEEAAGGWARAVEEDEMMQCSCGLAVHPAHATEGNLLGTNAGVRSFVEVK